MKGPCICEDILEAACVPLSRDPEEGNDEEDAKPEQGTCDEQEATDAKGIVGEIVLCIGSARALGKDVEGSCGCSDLGEGAN